MTYPCNGAHSPGHVRALVAHLSVRAMDVALARSECMVTDGCARRCVHNSRGTEMSGISHDIDIPTKYSIGEASWGVECLMARIEPSSAQ